jgi:hypothetical protein
MIVEYIRYTIDPGRNAEFDQAHRRAGALLDASPHCQGWEAARCVDEPGKQIVRIEGDSAEGHLQGFRQSADFKPFLEAVQPFYNQRTVVDAFLATVRQDDFDALLELLDLNRGGDGRSRCWASPSRTERSSRSTSWPTQHLRRLDLTVLADELGLA